LSVTDTPIGNLLAWIAPHQAGTYIGAFIGEDAALGSGRYFDGRAPAMQICSSPDAARRWVEGQAAAIGLPIKWLGEMP